MKKTLLLIFVLYLLLIVFTEHNSYDRSITGVFKSSDANVPQEVLTNTNFNYGLQSMDNVEIFQYVTNKTVKVALLDSGISSHHPLLKNHVIKGINIINSEKPTTDFLEHGTHIAGIISNKTPESLKIIPIKVIDDYGHGKLEHLINGIKTAINKKVNIINISLIVNNPNEELKYWIKKAYQKGIVIVAPTGNTGDSKLSYPANYKEVIAVGSYNLKESISKFSQYGKNIDFVAPGENILSTIPSKSYKISSGTSQSTAFVTRAIALYMLTNKYKNKEKLEKDLISSTEDMLQKGYDTKSGFGKISIEKLINN